MKWFISLASELHLQLFRNYPLVPLFPILIQWAINYKLESSMGLSDVHLNWDPLIYGDSWIEYFMIWTISNNPDCMMSMFNKSRIPNSHKWLSAQLLWNHLPYVSIFSSPHFLYYMLTIWSQLCYSSKILRLVVCVHSHSTRAPPYT